MVDSAKVRVVDSVKEETSDKRRHNGFSALIISANLTKVPLLNKF